MSTPVTLANTESAVQDAVNKLLISAAAKHGIAVADLPHEAIEDATRYAREQVESDQRNQANEFFHLYQQEKARRELAEKQISAVRENRTARSDMRTVDTMEQVRGRMGHAAWFQLSEAQKLSALGLDPASIDKSQLRTLFGRHTDTAAAVDFAKVNQYRYAQLRQAALALNITGK
jgi:hypothetical protein